MCFGRSLTYHGSLGHIFLQNPFCKVLGKQNSDIRVKHNVERYDYQTYGSTDTGLTTSENCICIDKNFQMMANGRTVLASTGFHVLASTPDISGVTDMNILILSLILLI